jgi:voltage-gated potassium channel Kch
VAQAKPEIGSRLWSLLRQRPHRPPRLNPILARLAWVTLTVLLTGTWYFHAVFGGAWLDAVYFVVATMTTTGYGDLTPDRSEPVEIVVAMLLMLSGITLTGLFIAFGASLLTRVHWVALQGLRPVHRRGHIVICGAGSIGSAVIDLLLAHGRRLVVVELNPDATIVERAREQHFDLLTGDASRDTTLDLCNLAAAHSLIALTNVDTLNLEIALGARARNPTMPIVLRIAEASFAESIARHFEFETTFSAAALAAPAFVGLGRVRGITRTRLIWGSGVCDRRDWLGRPPAGSPTGRNPDCCVARRQIRNRPRSPRSRSGWACSAPCPDFAVQGRERHARRRGGALPAA